MGYYLNKSSKTTKKSIASLLILSVLLLVISPFIYAKNAEAASLASLSIRLDRMAAGVTASASDPILVVFSIPDDTAATEDEIRITIPDASANGFTIDSTASNITTTTTGIPTTYNGVTLTAVPSLAASANAVNDGGNSTAIDIVIGDLDDDTDTLAFLITGGITNPSAGNAGTFVWTVATLASNTVVDTADAAVDTVGTNADQVTVTASVPATFNFAIADNALDLGQLSVNSVESDAMSSPIDIDTNANNGWIAWIRSEGAAATLASAATGDAISSTDTPGTPVVCSAGNECYVVAATETEGGSSIGTITIATEYASGSDQGGVLSTSYEQFASSDGPAADDQLTLTVYAAISGTNAAANDYTDTWEVVGAGNF